MKHKLTIIALTLFFTGAFAQSEMMHVPNGTSGISTTTNSRGVAIGPGFDTPLARVHTRDNLTNGTSILVDTENSLQSIIDGPSFWASPDYFIQARFKNNQLGNATYQSEFSVDINGKIQSGFSSTSVNEQLAVVNNMAIYRGTSQKIRLELSNNQPRFRWKSPGNNFQFVNEDFSTTALQLGEGGDVGVNTGTWTDGHKLHIQGGALSDYSVVQPVANWIPGGNYLGMYFSDRPEIRWDSDATSYFEFKAADTGEVPLRLSSAGKVGINTDNFENSNHSLYIAGSSVAEEMFVKLSDDWGDFVFEKEYDLMPLDELEGYLKENKHLPDFPSAAEIEKDGLALGETERLLTIKVEELTLYILELKKEIDTLKEEIKD